MNEIKPAPSLRITSDAYRRTSIELVGGHYPHPTNPAFVITEVLGVKQFFSPEEGSFFCLVRDEADTPDENRFEDVRVIEMSTDYVIYAPLVGNDEDYTTQSNFFNYDEEKGGCDRTNMRPPLYAICVPA